MIETLYILSGTTDLVLATNIDREICHTINSRQLCLMADVSIYTNYLMKVYIRFRRSAGCVSCDVILNSNIDKSYCKYKLIGTLLCFLQMNRVFFKDEGLNGIRPTNKTVSHCQTFFLNYYLISMTISYACYIISSF